MLALLLTLLRLACLWNVAFVCSSNLWVYVMLEALLTELHSFVKLRAEGCGVFRALLHNSVVGLKFVHSRRRSSQKLGKKTSLVSSLKFGCAPSSFASFSARNSGLGYAAQLTSSYHCFKALGSASPSDTRRAISSILQCWCKRCPY